MAGAISAGAYTTGVLDFLMEALEECKRPRTLTVRTDPWPRTRPLLVSRAYQFLVEISVSPWPAFLIISVQPLPAQEPTNENVARSQRRFRLGAAARER